MALATDQGRNDPILVAANTAATQVRVGDVTAGHIKQQVVTVKSTGKKVNVPTAVHYRTNFYIIKTRQYIPLKKLYVFINFRWFPWIMGTVILTQLGILSLVTAILSILGRLGAFGSSLACLVLSLVTILSLIPTFIIYCQHLHVVCWTIPWVLRQPVKPLLRTDNAHLEIEVTNQERVYMTAHESGIGLESQTTGKIKFHVLSPAAVSQIKWARNVSIFLAVMTFSIMIWAALVFIVSLIYTVTADKWA